MHFIERDSELKILEDEYSKKSSSFVAVYGRRRVGKTELVNRFFQTKECFLFSITGAYDSNLKSHLDNFADKFSLAFDYSLSEQNFKNWNEAFRALRDALSEISTKKGCKIGLFIDELPWLAQVKKDGFKSALSLFWNDFASKRDDIMLVVCGSATSWIIEHIIDDSGSLSNRVTAIIHLKSFNLKETKIFLKAYGCKNISDEEVLRYYMVLGGVAHYLKMINCKQSFVENIQRIFFTQNGILRTEYNRLFRSLFKNFKIHELIVEYLATTWSGLTLSDLNKKQKLSSTSTLTNALKELEESNFITKKKKFGQNKRDRVYRLQDPFIYFFTKWVKKTATVEIFQNKNYFLRLYLSHKYKIWSGYAFENICHNHIVEIKKALGVEGVLTTTHYWRYLPIDKNKTGTQIDLLMVREDSVANIIECKYHNQEFTITKKYAKELEDKVTIFNEQTNYKYSTQIAILTLNGINKNSYYNTIEVENIEIKKLFN